MQQLRNIRKQCPYNECCLQYKENLEMRMKYADQPEKFMESELGLDEEVQRLLAVAASPELYPDFVATGVIEHLMALLSHENTDIAADVLELFHELTDADAIEDSVSNTWTWAHHLSVYHTCCISQYRFHIHLNILFFPEMASRFLAAISYCMANEYCSLVNGSLR